MSALFRLLSRIPRPTAKSAWLYLGGFACLALTALMNRHAGVSQGATEEGRQLLGSAAIVIDIVGIVVFGSIAGNLIGSTGKAAKAMGVLVLLVVIGCAAFSISSIMSFVAGEWLSVSESRKAAVEAAKARQDAELQASKDRRAAQERLALSGQAMMQAQLKEAGRKEKRILSEKFSKGTSEMIEALGKEQGTAKPAEPAAAPDIAMRPDGGAEMISWMTTIPERTVQATRMAALAVLLIVLKLFAFPLGGYYYRKREIAEVVPLFAPQEQQALPAAPARLVEIEAPPVQLALPKTVEAAKVVAVPAPSSLPEPAPEWRTILEGLDYFSPRKGALRPAVDRKVLGYHWLAWCYAFGKVGDFEADVVERMYDEFCLAAWREQGNGVNVAKGELKEAALKLDKKAIIVRERKGKPTLWTITLKSPKRMQELLIKRNILRPSPVVAAKATPAPEIKKEATTESVIPFPKSEPVSGAVSPAVEAANDDAPSAPQQPQPIRGRAELQRFRPDLEAMRVMSRVEKTTMRARGHSLRPQHMHRFSRARAA